VRSILKARRRFLQMGSIAVLVALHGCSNNSDERAHAAPEAAKKTSALPLITVGEVALHVEIVQTDAERMRGLMFREQLPEDQGMLFVFEEAHIQTFWMRNTFIPLDIAFIDAEGHIVDIQHMAPLDETKSYVSPVPVPYVLEVNAGWCERHQVKIGEMVRF